MISSYDVVDRDESLGEVQAMEIETATPTTTAETPESKCCKTLLGRWQWLMVCAVAIRMTFSWKEKHKRYTRQIPEYLQSFKPPFPGLDDNATQVDDFAAPVIVFLFDGFYGHNLPFTPILLRGYDTETMDLDPYEAKCGSSSTKTIEEYVQTCNPERRIDGFSLYYGKGILTWRNKPCKRFFKTHVIKEVSLLNGTSMGALTKREYGHSILLPDTDQAGTVESCWELNCWFTSQPGKFYDECIQYGQSLERVRLSTFVNKVKTLAWY